jgi:hypothetical protein
MSVFVVDGVSYWLRMWLGLLEKQIGNFLLLLVVFCFFGAFWCGLACDFCL